MTFNGGALFGLFVGSLVPLGCLPLLMVAPAVLFLVLSLFLPKSPLWLMTVGRTDEARTTLTKLRGTGYHMEPEWKELEILTSSNTTLSSKMSLMRTKSFLLPLGIALTVFAIQVSTFGDALGRYSLIIFQRYSYYISAVNLATLFQVIPPFMLM